MLKNFYGELEGSEKADDILFALQVITGRPEYNYSDFIDMNFSEDEIKDALQYIKEKEYNKFTYFEQKGE